MRVFSAILVAFALLGGIDAETALAESDASDSLEKRETLAQLVLLIEFMIHELDEDRGMSGGSPWNQGPLQFAWDSLSSEGERVKKAFLEYQKKAKAIQSKFLDRHEATKEKWQSSKAELAELWKSAAAAIQKQFEKAQKQWAEDQQVARDHWKAFLKWLKDLFTPIPSSGNADAMPHGQEGDALVDTPDDKLTELGELEELLNALAESDNNKLIQLLQTAGDILTEQEKRPLNTVQSLPPANDYDGPAGKGFPVLSAGQPLPKFEVERLYRPQQERAESSASDEARSAPWTVELAADESSSYGKQIAQQLNPEVYLKYEEQRLASAVEDSLKRVADTTEVLRSALEALPNDVRGASNCLQRPRQTLEKVLDSDASLLSRTTEWQGQLSALDFATKRLQQVEDAQGLLEIQQSRNKVLEKWLHSINLQQMLLFSIIDECGMTPPRSQAAPLQLQRTPASY